MQFRLTFPTIIFVANTNGKYDITMIVNFQPYINEITAQITNENTKFKKWHTSSESPALIFSISLKIKIHFVQIICRYFVNMKSSLEANTQTQSNKVQSCNLFHRFFILFSFVCARV